MPIRLGTFVSGKFFSKLFLALLILYLLAFLLMKPTQLFASLSEKIYMVQYMLFSLSLPFRL